MYPTTNYQNEAPFEMDLCDLLQTLKLESSGADAPSHPNSVLGNVQDDPMDEVNYHSDGGSDYSSSSSSSNASNTVSNDTKGEAITNTTPVVEPNEIFGCAYLRAIRSQLETYPTTGGEYLEAIFTHREILSSFPVAHRDCARAFSDLAYLIEQRAWRSDRDADMDAVVAFRHEAWVIASTLVPVVSPLAPQDTSVKLGSRTSTACLMPPMY